MPKSRKSRKKRRAAAEKPATTPAAVSPHVGEAQEDTLEKPQPSAEEAATPTGAAPDKPPQKPEPGTGEPERRDTPKSRKPRKKRRAAKKPEATTPAAVSAHVGEAQEDTLEKRQPSAEEAATTAGAEQRDARSWKDPIASSIQQSPEGLLEEHPASASAGWTRRGGRPEDSRTLSELAASVMDAGPDEPPQPPAPMTEEPEPGDGGAETPADAAPDEPPQPPDARSRGRWAAVVIVLLLLFLAGDGFVQFGLAGGDPSEDLGAESGSAALPPGGEPPSEGPDAPSSADESLPAVVSDPTLTPTPTAVPAPVPTVAPAPAPTAAPVATVAPVPNSVHVGNLVYSVRTVGAKVKVSVEVYVHDSSHDPVAGATVTGEWTGASGSTSCSTGATPFCVVETKPLTAPGSVTFAVTGVASDAAPYGPALNHDADGDSNGTSITVTF